MTDEKFTKTLQLVKPTLEYKDFNGVDAVIEVIFLHPLHDKAKSLIRFPSEHSMVRLASVKSVQSRVSLLSLAC
jgi:hypothetical protein